MAATTQIQVIISAQDNATKVLNGVGDAVNKTAAQTLGMSNQAKQGADIVSTAFIGAGVAAAAFTGVSVKMASDFQSQMLLIQTQAGASAQEVKNMTKAVLDLAPAVGQTPQKLAEGLFFIESAGFAGAKALDILKLSAEGAAVGHDTLADVSKALTSVLNSQIKGVNGASEAMGVMDAIVGHGKMTMTDLTGAISTGILPAAKQAGVSLQSLGSALDVMTNNGIPATDAATRLRMTITLMADPTSKATDELKKVGLTQRSLADDMQKGGLIAAITDLNLHMNAVQQGSSTIVKGTKETGAQLAKLGNDILDTTQHLKNLGEQHVKAGYATDVHNLAVQRAQQQLDGYKGKLGEANTVINTLGGSTLDAVGKAQLLTSAFGGARSGSTIELLTQQTDQLQKSLTGINDTSGKFASSWKATQDSNAQATARLNATVQTLMIEYGTALLPVVTKVENFIAQNLAPTLSNIATFFEHNKIAVVALAVVLTGVLLFGLLAVGVSMWINLIAPTVAFIAFAVPAIAAAIGMAAAFILMNLPWIILGVVVVAVAILIMTHMKQIQAVVGEVANFFKNVWSSAIQGGQQLISWIESQFHTAVKNIEVFFTTVWRDVTTAFNNFIKWVTATFGPAFKVAMNVLNFIMIVVHDLFVVAWFGIQSAMDAVGKWMAATFGPAINLVFNVIKEYLQLQFNFWKFIWDTIMTVLKLAGEWLNSTFTPLINKAFNFIKVALSDVSNFFKFIWSAITDTLTVWGTWLNKEFTDMINTAFTFISKSLDALSAGWMKMWNGIKNFMVGIANDIGGIVKNMLNGIIGFFNGLINSANKVGGKIPGYIKIPDLPTFSTGGIVPGQIGAPTLIVAHGGETVSPLGTSRGDSGGDGGGVVFNINIGLYAGSDTEKRNIGKQLYAALLQLAQSQHKTVAAYMGG